MNKILYILGMMVAVASCAKDDTAALGGSEVVAFSTETTTSRVTTSGTTSVWEAGDAIGINCTEMDANYKYTATQAGESTSFTAASSDAQFLVSRDAASERTYNAYYPYQEGEYYTSDVTDQSDLGAIDLLIASATAQSTSTETVEFSFQHRLAMVNFEIEGLENVVNLEEATVVLTSDYAIFEYNFDGTERSKKSSGMITLNTEYDSESGKLTASGIVNARDGNTQRCVLTITDGAGSKFKTSEALFTFESANIYNYNVTIGVDGIDFTAGDITPWGTDNQGYWGTDMQMSADGFYEIYSASGLEAFASRVSNGEYAINGRLMRSVDLSGYDNWMSIGNYQGKFDGNGKRISGLTITGSSSNRGLFSAISGAKIYDLGVEGSVSGSEYVGGIVGEATNNSTITNCYFSGSVTATGFYGGGIVGYLKESSVTNCYSEGTVSGGESIGGVVGDLSDDDTITNCYSASKISGSRYCGGVVGSSYNSSTTDCYYDSTINSGVSLNGYGTSKTTEEMKSSDLLTLLNNAAAEYNTEETPEIEACEWVVGLDGYPTLNFGTSYCSYKLVDGVYEIYSGSGLKAFADLANGGQSSIKGKLMADVDISGYDNWTPISDYQGEFDGNGKVVSGLTITGSDNARGLFGKTDGANIHDLGVEGSLSGGDMIGGIVGEADNTTITNCYFSGSVTATDYNLGGIAGYIYESSTITNCYSEGTVSGGSYVGGIVGTLSSSALRNCYSASVVSGSSDIGGVVGTNSGSGEITNCYYDSTINSSFADMDGVTPKTTEEMKSSDLLTLLNDAAATYNFNTPEIAACEWIAGLGGYPTLNFGAEPTYSKDIVESDDDEYQIYTGEGLRLFADLVNGGDDSIKGYLMCSIDLEGIDAEDNGIVGKEFTPIGTGSEPYKGTFDGNGHCVSGLYINNPTSDYQGLFGCIYVATIKNLGVDGIVNGKSYVGGIAGYADFKADITNCYNLAAVQGKEDYIGGIVGYTNGFNDMLTVTVTGCYNKGAVTCSTCNIANYVGGIIGRAYQQTSLISNCYNRGTITNNSTNLSAVAAGIVGHYYNSDDGDSISNCYNAGSVSVAGNTFYRAGIVSGYSNNVTLVDNCYNNTSCTPYYYIRNGVDYVTGNMTESQMTVGSFATTLGSDWREDTESINDGYPVLSWQ